MSSPRETLPRESLASLLDTLRVWRTRATFAGSCIRCLMVCGSIAGCDDYEDIAALGRGASRLSPRAPPL